MGNILHLVDQARSLDYSLIFPRGDTSDSVVALSAEAAFELENHGISFQVCGDFYTKLDYERIGLENFHRASALLRLVDTRLAALQPELGKIGFELAETNYVDLKILLDSVSLAFFEIRKTCEAFQPSRILFHGFTDDSFASHETICFTNQEPLYHKVATCYAQLKGIPFEVVPPAKSSAKAGYPSAKRMMAHLKLRTAGFLNGIVSILSPIKSILLPVFISHILNSMKTRKTDPIVFLMHPGYDVVYVGRALIREGHGTLFCVDAKMKKLIRLFPFLTIRDLPDTISDYALDSLLSPERCFINIASTLFSDPDFRAFFTYDTVNLFSLFQDKFEQLFHIELPKQLTFYQACLTLFKDYPRAHLLMPTTAIPQMEMALKAAQKQGLHLHKYQHGSDGYFYFPLLEYQDLTFQGDLWVYGHGVQKAIAKHFKRDTRVVIVGSAALDSLQQTTLHASRNKASSSRERRAVVVYPLTYMAGNRAYFSYHAYPDYEYFKIQKQIVDVFRNYPEIELLIKVHPNPIFPESPIVRYIENNHIANCRIIRTTLFTKVIPKADLFVFDLPSTVLLQALTTTKPILIYNGALRFEPEAKDLIRRRCFYSEDFNVFLDTLRKTLDKKTFEETATDNEFMKQYGTYLDNGRSAKRAIDLLQFQPAMQYTHIIDSPSVARN